MNTMRAVRYLGPKRNFELRAVAIPEPGAGAVRVKIAACGICHTELHLRDGLLDLGKRDFTVGHEIAGVIDAVGTGVPKARIGERVVVYYYEGCGTCRYCRTGDEQLCANVLSQPGFSSDGGYADYITIRASNCVKIPDHVAMIDIAPMGCAGSTAIHAGKMATMQPGDWVVVHGVGGVGFALLQYALAVGARVIAVGIGADRLAMAKSLGATATIDAVEVPDPAAAVLALTGEGADVVFELVGTEATMAAATHMLRRRGRLVFIGYTTENYKIHPIELIVKELQLLGSVGSTLQDLHDIVDLVGQGKIRPVTDMTLPLESFEKGLQAIEARQLVGRAVLIME